ncbi:MAG TPA: multicopper oxidase domain-containing protein [Blastocatellia bacterium]|nr:multicopper oxidase domain-containing protein [Blastocatellia bacterium]
MAEADEVKLQADEDNETAVGTTREKTFAARRRFMLQALAATSSVALAEFLPPALLKAAGPSQAACPPVTDLGELTRIVEITRNGNNLQAVLRVVDGERTVPTSTKTSVKARLRYYVGHNPGNSSQSWPPQDQPAPAPPGPPRPGPTLRCSVGDNVQITFLNQVNVANFPDSLANGEYGKAEGCDELRVPGNKNYYPATDKFPNCLHASSAANIHFHGTHVTPSTTGDNVLVNIWPSTTVLEKDVQQAFRQTFEECETRHIPQRWEDLPLSWRMYQERLIKEYDSTAPYTGPGANPNGRGLPEYLRLWPQNVEAITHGAWPPYYVGSYPYCFKIPRYEEPHHPGGEDHPGVKMGQAPGTHWYHSHKHGSTAINMFNGLSGAFIIEDNTPTGYDGALRAFYEKAGHRLDQVVMVFQQIVDDPNLLRPNPQKRPLLVNGQFTPFVKMQPGQVQLWRMVNATVSAPITIQFNSCPATSGPVTPPPQFKQTAQDGVQYAYGNYNKPDNGKNPITMAPANRVDLLVQAPTQPGLYVVGTVAAPILFIQVGGAAMSMGFPKTEAEFPPMPPFLNDIKESDIHLQRRLVYGWDKGRTAAGRNPDGSAPQYTIDRQQFSDGIVNQVMLLDTAEEWTIYNETGVAHPFHIHVNPFQIVEVFDPNKMTVPLRIVGDAKEKEAAEKKYGNTRTIIVGPPIWWDNFAIPVAKTQNGAVILDPATGYAQTPGYFTMRSRFVDFTGQYVQHCHILAHEDRGMMQLLEVVSNKSVVKHH